MLNNKFLRLTTLSTLLMSTLLGAGTSKCVNGGCFATFDKPTRIMMEEINIDNLIDKSMTIVLEGETITVFPHSSYVMNGIEEETLLIESTYGLEEIILEKTELPNSEFFCDDNTKPLYDRKYEVFECV